MHPKHHIESVVKYKVIVHICGVGHMKGLFGKKSIYMTNKLSLDANKE